ncbi:hypothetical protein Barb4_01676 [Bacteroidales bacterium Barb4]|nr:hypothetical protein Barb4_01676 [Bacteroidales bacterium Barb4]
MWVNTLTCKLSGVRINRSAVSYVVDGVSRDKNYFRVWMLQKLKAFLY